MLKQENITNSVPKYVASQYTVMDQALAGSKHVGLSNHTTQDCIHYVFELGSTLSHCGPFTYTQTQAHRHTHSLTRQDNLQYTFGLPNSGFESLVG